jgi:hypothetical protein
MMPAAMPWVGSGCFPCARITSIRFKGFFSVALLAQRNTPSEVLLGTGVSNIEADYG